MDTQKFELDPRLVSDCHLVYRREDLTLLLMDDSRFPWFILVPHCEAREVFDLPPGMQTRIWTLAGQIGQRLMRDFGVEKINTAAIGNVVAQLHIHVVGRRSDDACWPGVVWGHGGAIPYSPAQVEQIKSNIDALTHHQSVQQDRG